MGNNPEHPFSSRPTALAARVLAAFLALGITGCGGGSAGGGGGGGTGTPGGGTFAPTVFADFTGAVAGNAVTPAALDSGTHCGTGHWELGANPSGSLVFSNAVSHTLHSSVNVCGTSYSGNTGLVVRHDISGTDVAAYGFPAPTSSASIGFFFYTTVPSTSMPQYDIARISSNADAIAANLVGDGTQLHLELEVADAATTQSGSINITPNTWYWITMQFNTTGSHKMSVYETTNWTLIGSASGAVQANQPAFDLEIGHVGGEQAPGPLYMYYANLAADYTTGTYPLGP